MYVVTFPEVRGKWQVSTSGGIGPQWRKDGLTFVPPFAAAADGQRFLLNTIVDESGGAPLGLVINGPALLR